MYGGIFPLQGPVPVIAKNIIFPKTLTYIPNDQLAISTSDVFLVLFKFSMGFLVVQW